MLKVVLVTAALSLGAFQSTAATVDQNSAGQQSGKKLESLKPKTGTVKI